MLPGRYCRASYTFGQLHQVGECASCHRGVPIKKGYCQLCWLQASLETQDQVTVLESFLRRFSCQQLFLSNMHRQRSKGPGPRIGRQGLLRKPPSNRDTIGVVISADELVSRRLLQVTVSWHTHPSRDHASLVHMWLHMSDLGPVRFHTAPDDSLELTLDQPHDSYDMNEYGQVTVDPAPDDFLMSRFLGQSIRAVHRIVDHQIETEIGLRLELDHGEVRILNLADELVITDAALPDAVEATLR